MIDADEAGGLGFGRLVASAGFDALALEEGCCDSADGDSVAGVNGLDGSSNVPDVADAELNENCGGGKVTLEGRAVVPDEE